MSNINAAIGLAQFKKIDLFRSVKRHIVSCYNKAFSDIDGISILAWDLEEAFPFAYTLRILHNRRDDLMSFLKKKGIDTSINYIPNHLHPFFKSDQKLPVTEMLYREIITLPLFVDMNDENIQYIINSVKLFFER
jgi:perosamine synthetase